VQPVLRKERKQKIIVIVALSRSADEVMKCAPERSRMSAKDDDQTLDAKKRRRVDSGKR
jgi:hypothetical protein